MALSRKNQRKLAKLRNEADRLWQEQQVVFEKAGRLASQAGGVGRDVTNEEILPPMRKAYDRNVRPAFEGGVKTGRKAMKQAEKTINTKVLPALAAVGGSVTGAVREFTDNNKTLQNVQDRTENLTKEAGKRMNDLQTEIAAVADKAKEAAANATKKAEKEAKKLTGKAKKAQRKAEKKFNKQTNKKKGLGFGGWFLIGSAVTAVAALGYALWQTFRADDDLWIADEELDAPVTSVEAPVAK